MIAIIDYDAGNIKSVEKALQYLGAEAVLTGDREIILAADKVILPGVGAFSDAMEKIRARSLAEVITTVAGQGTPFLGICLGMQLLFEESEEAPGVNGLGLLKGKIKRIPVAEGLKIPHIGWNSLSFPRPGRLFQGIGGGTFAYFVHSYYLAAAEEQIVTATAEYGVTLHVAVEKGNLFACQFHPEKSSSPGIQILDNFIHL